MNFFRSMDLYKGVVLASLILLPLGGYWIMHLAGEIDACRRTLTAATRKGGLLEEIGRLQQQVEIVVQNRRTTSEAIKNPGTYFEGQILAAAGQRLKTNDFSPKSPREEPASLGGRSKQQASDFVVDIDWRRDLEAQMSFVYAVLFNCESGARAGDQAAQPSVWKLRELELVNATDERTVGAFRVPPPELEDRWLIRSMKFARREPKRGR